PATRSRHSTAVFQRGLTLGHCAEAGSGSGSGAAPSTMSVSSAKPPTLRFENPIATSSTTSATAAIVQRAGLLSRRGTTAGGIGSDPRFITLINGLSAGPAVSLNGSPTVSPITAALWASDPLPP